MRPKIVFKAGNCLKKQQKRHIKIFVLSLCLAVIAAIVFGFGPIHAKRQKPVNCPYVLVCPLSGACLYKCPNSQGWEKFSNKPIMLPVNSFVATKNKSSLNLVFSKDIIVSVPENTQIKLRLRHKKTDSPIVNIYKLARREIRERFAKEEFRFNRPTVMSTI